MRAAKRVALSGLAAAAVFTIFSMLWFGVGGEGAWRPLNLAAHTLWRQAPADAGFHASAALLGALAITVVALLVMAPYGALAIGAGLRWPFLVIGGAIYANVVWVFGHYLLWEALDPFAAQEFSAGVAWAGHMIAGLFGGAALIRARPPDRFDTTAKAEGGSVGA